MATTFGWKRKLPQNVTRKRAAVFDEGNQIPDNDEDEPFEEDWRVFLVKRRGILSIEDSVMKSKRLEDEGVSLAEQQRCVNLKYMILSLESLNKYHDVQLLASQFYAFITGTGSSNRKKIIFDIDSFTEK